MSKHNFTLDKLVYLDLEFVSRKYEEILGVDPGATFTHLEGGSAGVKAFFANAGVMTQESRSYSITSRAMLDSIWDKLQVQYEEFSTFKNYEGTRLRWMTGNLGLAEWKERDSDEPGFEYFELKIGVKRVALLAQPSYLSAGFSQVFSASVTLKANISIPVRCLARVMWHAEAARNYVACPYIIIES